jgi:hypothetical protein
VGLPGGKWKTTLEGSKIPVSVNGSLAVRMLAPPGPALSVSVITGVPVPVPGSVVVPLKTPWSVNVSACAGNAEAPDNAITKAAEAKPRDEFLFKSLGNVPSTAKRARRAAIPTEKGSVRYGRHSWQQGN